MSVAGGRGRRCARWRFQGEAQMRNRVCVWEGGVRGKNFTSHPNKHTGGAWAAFIIFSRAEGLMKNPDMVISMMSRKKYVNRYWPEGGGGQRERGLEGFDGMRWGREGRGEMTAQGSACTDQGTVRRHRGKRYSAHMPHSRTPQGQQLPPSPSGFPVHTSLPGCPYPL